MKLLPLNSTADQVLEDFPMLEEVSAAELTIMKYDCSKEDAPFVRAIDILLKLTEKGKYFPPTEED